MGTLGTVPLLTALRRAQGPWEAFCAGGARLADDRALYLDQRGGEGRTFPAALRATGVGLPYALAVSVFGGTAEYIALWFKQQGMESGFYYYASGVIFCSLLVYYFLPDTKKTSLLDREAGA